MGIDDEAYDLDKELDGLERERIEKQNVLDFRHEELHDIEIQLLMLKEKAKTSKDVKFRLDEKIQERNNCRVKIKLYQNELNQINEKIIESEISLLGKQKKLHSLK